MKKVLFVLILALLPGAFAQGKRISQYPSGTPALNDYYVSELADGSTNNRVTLQEIHTVTATGSTTARTLEARFAEVFNVKDFGALGDGSTDDAAAIQAALDACEAAGGGRVYFPPGTYKADSQLVGGDGVEWIGDGPHAVTLDLSASTATGAFILIAGSETALPNLATQIDVGDTTVDFASAPALSAGDLYMIYSTDVTTFASASYQGEFFTVAGVNGTTVTNRGGGSYDLYATGVDKVLAEVTPVSGAMKGLKVIFKQGVTTIGIRLDYGRDFVFEDLNLSGSRWANLAIYRSYNTSLKRVVATDDQASVGLNYGVMHMHSQTTRAEDCYLETSRHGWATGGDEVAPVNRDIRISNSYVGSSQRLSFGLDFHKNTEHVTVANCTLPNGVDWEADHVKVYGCWIGSATASGIAVYAEAVGGVNWTMEENQIHASMNFSGTSPGLIHWFTVATTTAGRVRFNHNDVFMYDFSHGTTTRGFYFFRTIAGGGVEDVSVSVRGNNIYSTTSSATKLDRRGIDVLLGASYGLKSLHVEDNELYGVELSTWGNVKEASISRNKVYDSVSDGIITRAVTTPSYSAQTWHYNANEVYRANRSGIYIDLNTTDTARVTGNWSINNGVDSLQSAGTRISLYVDGIGTIWVENNWFGDTSATPTQGYISRFLSTGTLHRSGNRNVGLGVNTITDLFSSVTTSKFYGDGGGEVVSKTAAYTATPYDHTILADTSAGGFTVTLPAAANVKGKMLVILKTSNDSNTLTVDGNASETINGATTQSSTIQYDAFLLQSDGSGWKLARQVATQVVGLALGDLSTTITAGSSKAYWVAPYNGTFLGAFGSVLTASSSGVVTYDINVNGSTVLSTKLTIDANETSSITAATPAVFSSTTFNAGDRITLDIDTAGTGAVGPQINIPWARR